LAADFAQSAAVLVAPDGRRAPLYPLGCPISPKEPLYLYDGHFGIRIEAAAETIERSYVYYLGVHHRTADSAPCAVLKRLLARRRISFLLGKEQTAPWTVAESAADYSRRTIDDLVGRKYFPECYVPFEDIDRLFDAFLKVPDRSIWPPEGSGTRYANGLVLVGLAGAGKTALLARKVEELVRPGPGTDVPDRESPNLVLFLRGNGLTLRSDGVSLFRDVAERLGVAVEGLPLTGRSRPRGGFSSFRELLDHLHRAGRDDRVAGRRLVLVFDALNEAPHAERVLVEAFAMIREASRYPWVKIVISTRQEWLSVWSGKVGAQEISPLEELRPYLFAPETRPDRPAQGAPVLMLEPFDEGQARQVYANYQAAARGEGRAAPPGGYPIPACPAPWFSLPPKTRDLLKNPLYLHLFMEAFHGVVPGDVESVPELFRLYVRQALGARPGLAGAIGPVLAFLLADSARPGADLTDDDCNAIRRRWAEGLTPEELRLSLSPMEALAHEGFVSKRVREEGGGYRFVFQKVAEYLIYRYLAGSRPEGEDEIAYWSRYAQRDAVFAEYTGAFGFLLREWPVERAGELGPFVEGSAGWVTDALATFLVEQGRSAEATAVAGAAARALINSGGDRCARALHLAGVQLRDSRFPLAAVEYLRACIALREAAAASPDATDALGRVLSDYGLLLSRLGRAVEAQEALTRAVALYESHGDSAAADLRFGAGFAAALLNLALVLRTTGRLAKAEDAYRRSATINDALWRAHPDDVEIGLVLGRTLVTLGDHLNDRSRTAEAESAYRRAVEVLEHIRGTEPGSTAILRGLGEALHGLGSIHLNFGRDDQASQVLARAVEIMEGLRQVQPEDVELAGSLGRAWTTLGNAEAKRKGDALLAYRQSVSVFEALDPEALGNLDLMASYAGALGMTGRLDEAERLIGRVLDRLPLHPEANRWRRQVRSARGGAGDPRKCGVCGQEVIYHVSLFRRRVPVAEHHLCHRHAEQILTGAASLRAEQPGNEFDPEQRQGQNDPGGRHVLVDVELIVISEQSDQQIVHLREVGGMRRFSWVLGFFEAASIDRRLSTGPAMMPLTHDALVATVVALGGLVIDVAVGDLRDDTYYAEVRIDQGGRLLRLDARPGDAVSLALTCGVPIFVRERFLEG
jgi:bifunctional DNase/RNase/tetratricopeptide (TPR) repeat protein